MVIAEERKREDLRYGIVHSQRFLDKISRLSTVVLVLTMRVNWFEWSSVAPYDTI